MWLWCSSRCRLYPFQRWLPGKFSCGRLPGSVWLGRAQHPRRNQWKFIWRPPRAHNRWTHVEVFGIVSVRCASHGSICCFCSFSFGVFLRTRRTVGSWNYRFVLSPCLPLLSLFLWLWPQALQRRSHYSRYSVASQTPPGAVTNTFIHSLCLCDYKWGWLKLWAWP